MAGPSAVEIRARMARIRTRAHGKASRLGGEARQFLDWKHYVKLFPWGTLALAAAAGYLLVPRKHPIAPSSRSEARRPPGLLNTAFGLVGNILLRAGIAYASQQAVKLLASPGGGDQPQGSHRHDRVQPVA